MGIDMGQKWKLKAQKKALLKVSAKILVFFVGEHATLHFRRNPVELIIHPFLLKLKIMSKLIDLQSQIASLQKQADELRAKDFEATVGEIRQKMQAFGITVKDLQSTKIKPKAGRKPKIAATVKPAKTRKPTSAVAAKYRGPNGETWSGRGLTPKWLASLITAGGTKEQYLIAA